MVLFEILPRLKEKKLLKNLHANNLHKHLQIILRDRRIFLPVNSKFENKLFVGLCTFLH